MLAGFARSFCGASLYGFSKIEWSTSTLNSVMVNVVSIVTSPGMSSVVRVASFTPSKSAYVWTPDEVAAKIRQRTPEEARAEPTFKLGVHFFEQGDETLARTYWERAEELHPDSWNYRRQDWSFTEDGSSGVRFRDKRSNLEDTPYYAPLDLLETPATPPQR